MTVDLRPVREEADHGQHNRRGNDDHLRASPSGRAPRAIPLREEASSAVGPVQSVCSYPGSRQMLYDDADEDREDPDRPNDGEDTMRSSPGSHDFHDRFKVSTS